MPNYGRSVSLNVTSLNSFVQAMISSSEAVAFNPKLPRKILDYAIDVYSEVLEHLRVDDK